MATTDDIDNLFVVCLSVTKRGIFNVWLPALIFITLHMGPSWSSLTGRRTSTYFPQSLREDNHDPGHEHFCVQIQTINNDGV